MNSLGILPVRNFMNFPLKQPSGANLGTIGHNNLDGGHSQSEYAQAQSQSENDKDSATQPIQRRRARNFSMHPS